MAYNGHLQITGTRDIGRLYQNLFTLVMGAFFIAILTSIFIFWWHGSNQRQDEYGSSYGPALDPGQGLGNRMTGVLRNLSPDSMYKLVADLAASGQSMARLGSESLDRVASLVSGSSTLTERMAGGLDEVNCRHYTLNLFHPLLQIFHNKFTPNFTSFLVPHFTNIIKIIFTPPFRPLFISLFHPYFLH